MIRLAVRCDPARAEEVLAELTVLAPGGVEERSGPGWVEYAIYGAAGEIPDVGDLEAAAGDGLVAVSSSEVADDWADRWREYHRPVLVGDRVWLRPPWEEPRAGALDVAIDPGQAFGTGAHPTTRLCVELMLEIPEGDRPRQELLDLGTGSGVLAIAARRLGWERVRACDNDRAAVAAAAENAAANKVDIALETCDLRAGLPTPAPLVVANLTAPLLRIVAGHLSGGPKPQTLICSGLLATETDDVASAFTANGLTQSSRRVIGDWAGLTLSRGQTPQRGQGQTPQRGQTP
jgi:ribosomal protein L11 methyltransferase